MEEEITAEDVKRDRKAPERSCIVTRIAQDKSTLIRFVLAPDATLIPDVAAKLPGRGYWVSCSKSILQRAMHEKRFVKASKGKAIVPESLLDNTETLLRDRALASLALAKKAGALIAGAEKIAQAIKGNSEVIALIHAQGASQDSKSKLQISIENRYECFPNDVLSAKLGLAHAVHLALLDLPAGHAAVKEIKRFTGFLES